MMGRKSLFDELSRILASEMPRRQALHLVTGLLAGAVLTSLLPSRAWGRQRPDAKATLQLPVSQLVQQKVDVIKIVQQLENHFNVPVSFIQALHDNLTTIHVVDGTAQDVLDQILHQNPMYQVRQVKGRLILMPKEARYNTKVNGITIKNVPREQATQEYLAVLCKLKNFEEVEGLAMAGSWTIIYTTPVTLDRKASVIEHFVELLSDDETLYFSLHKGASGYMFWFGNVKKQSAKDFPIEPTSQ